MVTSSVAFGSVFDADDFAAQAGACATTTNRAAAHTTNFNRRENIHSPFDGHVPTLRNPTVTERFSPDLMTGAPPRPRAAAEIGSTCPELRSGWGRPGPRRAPGDRTARTRSARSASQHPP